MNFNLSAHSPVRYIVYIVLLLPLFIFRDYTPTNELKYICIIEDALRNNTWFTFYYDNQIYADKPPLFFWLILLSRILTGGYHMWIIGLFSLLPAIGICMIMDKWFNESNIKHSPYISNLLLLTTAIFAGSALVVRMDMLMTLFIVLSLYTFLRIYENRNRPVEIWLLPIYIFLAVFTKGPMGFLIPLLSIIVFLIVKGKIRFFGIYFGWRQWVVLFSLCTIWFLSIYLEGGSEYLNNILFKQTVGRGVNSFHHKQPVWFYLPRLLWTLAPWIILCIVLLWKGIYRKLFRTDTQLFFGIIIASNFVLLSIISAKLDIYLLPLYPFAIYLCSSFLLKEQNTIAVRIGVGIPALVFASALPALIIGYRFVPYDFTGVLPYAGSGLLSIAGIISIILIIKKHTGKAIISGAGGILICLFLCAFTLPQFNRFIGFRQMAEEAGVKANNQNIRNYAYYKFNSGSNLEVFVGQQLEQLVSVEQLDSLETSPEKTIVFFREKEIERDKAVQNWIADKRPEWAAGQYSWYIVGRENRISVNFPHSSN